MIVVSLIILSVIGYITWRVWEVSRYYKIKERLNIVVYSPRFYFYSIDLRSDLDYLASLPLEYKIEVPGGYGEYFIGSVGKLSALEKDLSLIKKTTSRLFAVPVDFVVFQDLEKVYQKPPADNETLLRAYEVFLLSSDASLAEKIYLFFKLIDSNKRKIKKISAYRFVEGERINIQKLNEYTNGLFLSSALRRENRIVQIYTSYPSAGENLMQVLEGVGVNVFEISQIAGEGPCKIVEYTTQQSQTAIFLQSFLNCKYVVESNKKGIVDIDIFLNKKSEQWR